MIGHVVPPRAAAAVHTDGTPLRSEVAVGAAALERIEASASFIDRHASAFCTTSAWLRAAARNLGGEPVVITVHDAGSTVVALAACSRSRQRGVWGIALLGGEFNDYGQLYYASESAGVVLATATAAWVQGEHRAWSLALDQLPEGDPAVATLLDLLPRARLEPGPPIPQIRGIGTDYLVSRNRRRKANNAVHRIEADGLAWHQVTVHERTDLDRWLPTVIDVRRERDHACGRRSHLDDPGARAFYVEVVRDLCDAGRLHLDLLLVDGTVAGYGMVVADPSAHRVFDGRVAEGLTRYRGGLVCDLMAVQRAEADPSVATFDWLRGRAGGKFGNDEVMRVGVVAASHAVVERLDRWDDAARRAVKALLPDAALRRIARR